MRYARAEGGLAQPFLQQLRFTDVLGATTVFMLALTWTVGLANALLLAVLVVLVARGISLMATWLVGGMTGDILGAVNELAEIAFLIAAPVIVGLEKPSWLPA